MSSKVEEILEHAREAERKSLTDALKLYFACLEICPVDNVKIKADCFAGIGRIELEQRSPFGLVYLEHAGALYQELGGDEHDLMAVKIAVLHAKALQGNFVTDSDGDIHILQSVVRRAQDELKQRHYRHCALALDCLDALSEGDEIVLEISDRMRRKLARTSKQAVHGKKMNVTQAMATLQTIEREDTPGWWAQSWTPWVVSFTLLSVLAGTAVVLYTLPERGGPDVAEE